jgi:hypothetical protein
MYSTGRKLFPVIYSFMTYHGVCKGVIRSRKSKKDKQRNGQRSEGVMLSIFKSSIIQLYHGDEKLIFNNVMMRSANQRLLNWYLLLPRYARNIKQRLVGSESGKYVQWGDMSIRGLLFQ